MTAEAVARTPLIATNPKEDPRLYELAGWAMYHQPTREAYHRCTGEDVGPALDRYQAWLEQNILGGSEDMEC